MDASATVEPADVVGVTPAVIRVMNSRSVVTLSALRKTVSNKLVAACAAVQQKFFGQNSNHNSFDLIDLGAFQRQCRDRRRRGFVDDRAGRADRADYHP